MSAVKSKKMDKSFTFPRLRRRPRWPVLNYLIIGLGALAMLLPFLWMLSTSFKVRGEILVFPPTLLPHRFTLENYTHAIARLDIVRLYWNTGYVALSKTLLMLYTASLLGYIFGKFKFTGQELIFYFILFTM